MVHYCVRIDNAPFYTNVLIMKKSSYNIIIRSEKASLIFNSFTNSYVALSNSICNAFESLQIDEFKNKYKVAYQNLCEHGVNIPDTRDELANIR